MIMQTRNAEVGMRNRKESSCVLELTLTFRIPHSAFRIQSL